MKRVIAWACVFLCWCAGCVTMPEDVPDAYLVEKTVEDQKAIDSLTSRVIAKRQEIAAGRQKVNDAEQKAAVEKGRLNLTLKERDLLFERQKQYRLENDQAGIAESSRQIAEKETAVESQRAKVEHAEASVELAKAQVAVSEAELSVLVAELKYRKAKIAAAYLEKQKSGGDEKKPEEPYDKKYADYLATQREILTEKQNGLEKAAMKVKIAEQKLGR